MQRPGQSCYYGAHQGPANMRYLIRTGKIMRSHFRFVLGLAVFAAALAIIAAAQQTQAPQANAQASGQEKVPVLKVTSRLVLVDVVALDRKGGPVKDLKAEDFTMLEEGREQKLRSFSFHDSAGQEAAASGAPVIAEPAKMPANYFTNVPRYNANRALNIVLLDGLNTRLTNQKYAREEMIKFLEKVPNGQPVAIYAMGTKLRLIQDFTTDTASLRAAIKNIKNHPSQVLENGTGGPDLSYAPPGLMEQMPPAMAEQMREFQAENISYQTDLQVALTLEMLDSLARTLAGYPGRKNLVWVSETFPLQITPITASSVKSTSTQRDYTAAVAKTANNLTNAQVAVYPIDARGLVSNGVYSNLNNTSSSGDYMGRTMSGRGGAGNAGIGSELDRTSEELIAAHTTMNDLADRTGGKAFYNRNELDGAIRQSMEDGSIYYTLAYSPDNKNWDGNFRKINVKTNRDGVKLRYRAGYFANDPQSYAKVTTKNRAQELGVALSLDVPVSTALLFQSMVLPPSEKTNNKVVINYGINPHSISFEEQADGLQHASLDCAVEVYSPKGDSLKSNVDGITAALPPDVYQKVMKSYLPCQQKLDLGPGNYILRLGVRDNQTGAIGTANAKVTVPPPAAPGTN